MSNRIRRTFYREADGHTYWLTENGWMGTPTFTDGTIDIEDGTYVEDFIMFDRGPLDRWLAERV